MKFICLHYTCNYSSKANFHKIVFYFCDIKPFYCKSDILSFDKISKINKNSAFFATFCRFLIWTVVWSKYRSFQCRHIVLTQILYNTIHILVIQLWKPNSNICKARKEAKKLAIKCSFTITLHWNQSLTSNFWRRKLLFLWIHRKFRMELMMHT